MDGTELYLLAALLGAMSVAAERLVELYNATFEDPDTETLDQDKGRWRRMKPLLLSIAAGILVAWGSLKALQSVSVVKQLFGEDGPRFWTVIVLGILSSGGSSFWNSIATYANKVKALKGAEVERQKLRIKTERLRLQKQNADVGR